MSYNSKAQKVGISFKKQSALQTANVSADFWNVGKTNAGFGSFQYVTENDAQDIGTGTDWATQVFPSYKDAKTSLQKRVSSEWVSWLACFGLGGTPTVVAQGTTGKKYTVKPLATSAALDLPAFSVVEQLGTLDRCGVGMVVNSFGLSFQSGPGRNNTTATCELVGCGSIVEPSGVTLPSSPLAENLLSGSSATVTINGTDYVANKSLISLDFNYSNNVRLDSGFFIGSGVENNFAIRGRMERGDRTCGMTFVARMESGGTEYTKLKNLTTGTAVITLTGAAFETTYNHKVTLTLHKCQYSAVEVGDSNGIATLNVTVTPLEDPTNGVLTLETVTQTANIGS